MENYEPPIKGMTKVIEGHELPFIEGMFISFVSFSLGQEESIKAFTKDTGIAPPRFPNSPIEKMIDDSCGYNPENEYGAFIAKFADWLTVNWWGEAENSNTPNNQHK